MPRSRERSYAPVVARSHRRLVAVMPSRLKNRLKWACISGILCSIVIWVASTQVAMILRPRNGVCMAISAGAIQFNTEQYSEKQFEKLRVSGLYAEQTSTGWRPLVIRVSGAWHIVIPFWIPSSIFMSILSVVQYQERRAHQRHALGLCVSCGYDNRSSRDSGVCPECGTILKHR